MDFCKEFNARTAQYVPGTPIPAMVTVRPDRSFTFELRTPPTATLLMSAAGVAPVKNKLRGAGNTAGPTTIGRLIAAQVTASSKAEPDAVSAGAQAIAQEGDEAVTDSADGRSAYSVTVTGKASGKELNGNAKLGTVGTVSLKHVYEIAKIKAQEPRLEGLGLEKIAKSVIAQAGSMGVLVVP